jgi:hypothetical protein
MFLDRLRAYLERVARAPEGLPAVQVDLSAHRQHFARAYDCVQRAQEARFQVTPREEWDHDLVHREQQRIQEVPRSLAAGRARWRSPSNPAWRLCPFAWTTPAPGSRPRIG